MNLKRLLRTLASWLMVLAITLILFEGLLEATLRYPVVLTASPKGFADHFRTYYLNVDRKLIQHEAYAARFDEKLFYTLKPGTFQFANREFAVSYNVNSLGLRDDEASLISPQVIVLGDSQAMGWGVEQNANFPALVEQATGKKVLNASVSSYGTAREVKLLSMLDTSKLEWLIVQYSDNDARENEEYFQNGRVLPISGQWLFDAMVARQKETAAYFPFKHARHFLEVIWMVGTAQAEEAGRSEAQMFLEILKDSEVLRGREDVKVLVIETNGYNHNDSSFVDDVKKLAPSFPAPLASLATIDLSTVLTEAQNFILDDHMNADGHVAVAEAIGRVIKKVEHSPTIGVSR